MQINTKVSTFHAAAIVAFLGAVAGLTSQMVPSVSAPVAATTAVQAVRSSASAAGTSAAAAVAAVAAAAPSAVPAVQLAAPAARAAVAFASEEALRARIKWVPVKYGGEKLKTLDEASRILLAQAAAERAGLQKVGLSFHDVYGLIDAETSWIPRSGMGRNGVESHGLAQFEPRTAKGLGLKNPNDPVQAVYFAALNMKHGAEWAGDKIAHLKLSPAERAMKIREGVSIYYNLSVKGRNKWDGFNTAQLPVETQRHITNVREGAEKAAELAEGISI
jgi:soluble lytic murein transglycosylase-like protein